MNRILALFLLISVCSYDLCWSTIINIPADYPNIQQGIDASTDGDTVLVQPGTYYEKINFNGHNIVLGSLSLITGDFSAIDLTTIDGSGGGPGSIIRIENGDDQTMIMGFTIKNGSNTQYGGGISCYNSSPSIIYNKIIDNSAGSYNQVTAGGGISLRNNSDAEIKNNVIFNNFAGSYNNNRAIGGGIYCEDSDAVILNNIIFRNMAWDYLSYFKSGICCFNSNPEIINNVIWANVSGEIYLDSLSSANIAYCNIKGGYSGSNIIDVNPLFMNPDSNNFNFCSQSPCIDSGDPTIIDPDGTTSDIGVYYPSHPNCEIGNRWYVDISGLDSNDGSFENPFRTIQHAINMSFHYDTIIVNSGWYNENIDFTGIGVLVGSNYIFTSDTTDIQSTFLDGTLGGFVAAFRSGEDSNAGIMGMTIQYGSSVVGGGGVVCDNSSSPTISDNFIHDNYGIYGGGIECSKNSNAVISGNRIYNNENSGIFCFLSDPVIRDNLIFNNESIDEGGGIKCIFSDPLILNNSIDSNSSDMGGGIYCAVSSDPAIIGNHIGWNFGGIQNYSRGGGIACMDSSVPIIVNNIVRGNQSVNGGGIYIPSILINNTIIENHAIYAGGGHGGGIYCVGPVPITNNIIRGNVANGSGSQIYGSYGGPIATYCNVEGGWNGLGNIDIDPFFRSPSSRDFHLMSTTCGDSVNSPCIDAGNPLIQDIVLDCDWGLGTLISDMGAYGGGDSTMLDTGEYLSPLPEKHILFQNYPNPFNFSTTIEFGLSETRYVKIEIYDILGRRIETLIDEYRQAGIHTVSFDASHLSSGVYFYRFQAGDAVETKRMVLLK